MTTIGKSEQARPPHRELEDFSHDQTFARSKQKGMHGHAQFDFSEEALLSNDPFGKDDSQMNDEASSRREDRHDDKSGDDKTSTKEAEIILAMASGALAPATATPVLPAQTMVLQVSGAGPADDIMKRIEQAVSAALHDGSRAPLAFKLQLDDLQIPGLKSLHVAMSAHAVDVSIGRDAGALTPQILAAAQSLADRLAVRFPARVVTVRDLDSDGGIKRDSEDSQSGMRAISALLAQKGTS